MSLHVYANIVTPFGTASNNRGDNDGGNTSCLQKLIWYGEPHTTVSAEAIRFAIRRSLLASGEACNRRWAEHQSELPESFLKLFSKNKTPQAPCNWWEDPAFKWYEDPDAATFADDDLLGFMSAEAAKEEAEGDQLGNGETGSGKKKGKASVRRSVLELTRAVSVTPWDGNVTFNAASRGATLSAQKKGSNPAPYAVEVHATRYQYGLALTPECLRDTTRAAKALIAIGSIGTVAGNHGRFLFDFSPDSIVLRITDDPAPRLLYCFASEDNGQTITVTPSFYGRVGDAGADVAANELIIGGEFASQPLAQQLGEQGAAVFPYRVKDAIAEACRRINSALGLE